MGVTAVALAALVAAAPLVRGVEVRLPDAASSELQTDLQNLLTIREGEPLSLMTVRRSIERLMASGRFADVEVRVDDRADGVVVIFDVQLLRAIRELHFAGQVSRTPEELQSLINLTEGAPYWPERAESAAEAIRRAYRRRGYLGVDVVSDAWVDEGGVVLTFNVKEGLPVAISSIVLAGDIPPDGPNVMETLGLRVGDPLDLEAVERGVDAVRESLRRARYFRARVDPAVVDAAGSVALAIDVGPRLGLAFWGNRSFSTRTLESVLAYRGEEPLDSTTINRLRERLEAFYRARGFERVAVHTREHREGGSAVVRLAIEEGAQLLVKDIAFEGREAVSESSLRDILNLTVLEQAVSENEEPRFIDPTGMTGRTRDEGDISMPPGDGVFVEAAYREAARRMTALYQDKGYLDARVELQRVEIAEQRALVRFAIAEGRLHTVKRVLRVGVPENVTLRSPRETVGEPFVASAFEADRAGLLWALRREGYLFVTVEGGWDVDADAAVTATFRVVPGPQVHVGKILVRGLERTDERVVRRAAQFAEGEPLDPDRLAATQRALLSLGVFRSVDVRLLSPDAIEGVKDIAVEVREGPRLSGEAGFGYFLAEGPRGVFDGTMPNLFGEAISLSAQARLNFFALSQPALARQVDVSDLQAFELFGGRGNVSVSNHGLLPLNLGARIDLVGERVFRQSYRFSRLAAAPGLDWEHSFQLPAVDFARLKFSVLLQYEIEDSWVFRVNNPTGVVFPLIRADQERLRFLFGNFATHSLRLTPTLDLRDDPLNPHKGVLLQVSGEGTFDISARDQNNAPVVVQLLKVSGTLTGYVPLPATMVLALSIRGGRIVSLDPRSVTPPVKRFFLGGASSMRGFREDGLVAEDQRQDYAQQRADCQALVASYGCTPAAQTLLAGREIASQGGEFFGLGKAELRLPAFRSVDLGVFFEAGNLWLGLPTTTFRLRTVAGAGLRYLTPIGPLALDIGANLAPDASLNESALTVHFNIGVF